MSFNPGLMCLNLLICAKNMESILPTQITVLICGNCFNPVILSQPFKSLLFSGITINSSGQEHEGEFVTDVSTLFTG